MSRSWIGLTVLGLAMTFLPGSSCLQIERPYPPPSKEQLLRLVAKRGEIVHSLRAETRMRQDSPRGSLSARVRMMAQRPDRLRFDAVTPFDTPLSTLVTKGTDFALVDAQQNRHYYGPASPCNLARLLLVALDRQAVIAILSGSTPIIAHQSASLAWDGNAANEVLTLRSVKRRQVIRLDGQLLRGKPTWDVVGSEIHDARGRPLLKISFSNFTTQKGVRVPRRLRITQPARKTTLTLQFVHIDLNRTLPQQAFTLPAANGLPSQRVDCQGQP